MTDKERGVYLLLCMAGRSEEAIAYKKRVEGQEETKMKNCYEVSFDTKKGFHKGWVIHVEANTATEAKELVSEMWRKDSRLNDMHQFHVKVRRLKDIEEFKYHYFAICRY